MQFFKYVFPFVLIFFIACKSADDYLQEGNTEARQGNYNMALEKFKKAIEKNSKFKIAYIKEGYCYEDMTQYNAAIKSYQALLVFDPKNTTALFQIGKCNEELQKFAEAIIWYNKALDSKGYGSSDSAHMQVIMNWNKEGFLGETDQAKFDVNSNEIFFNRGYAFYASGQLKKAYVDFKECIDEGYFVGSSYYMLGVCWLRSGKKDRACEAFSKGSFYGDSLSTNQLSINGCN
jgi:tetratricopeptide (TPR) repeat protein